jgi:predicted PhzF superfamily epimerase YddE/YHI9
MIKKYCLYQIDSFTKEKFTGNPAGVITNADGLTSDDMQKIARELNNSETAFIFSSNCSEYDVHIRFFTPTNEVPICGHATIAAHYARAVENKLDTSRVYQKTGAGILPVDIVKENDDYKIVMTQGKIELGTVIDGVNKKELLAALNIINSDLLEDYDALSNLSKIIKCNGYYVFTVNSQDSDILIHGRMFAPAIGVNEDPVTGNANGPLGAYLVHHNFVRHNNSLFKFKAKQGESIGRPGIIEVEVKIEDKEPLEVKISGNAVIIFKSELSL